MKDLIHESILTAQKPLAHLARNPKASNLLKAAAQKAFVELGRIRFHVK
ncbi:hypothetical protein H6F98_00355 [Microcoleus sp. FACHB-SPT15]|nr:hypothetical protein [Microcoleus sp. FACHB-SPT15]MBD1803931.1 hypothetical protein [Microcoleus sp. FACHB-SPT15]